MKSCKYYLLWPAADITDGQEFIIIVILSDTIIIRFKQENVLRKQ
jgi:hypothetical protein